MIEVAVMVGSEAAGKSSVSPKRSWLFRPLVFGFGHLLSTAVLSQTVLPMPPERVQVDQNGVDIASGDIVASNKHLSIGSDEYGLSLTSVLSGAGWTDSLSGMLEVSLGGVNNSEISRRASWGNKSYSFPSHGWRSETNATLSQLSATSYALTLADGTVVTYTELVAPMYICEGTSDPCAGYFYPTKVERPNGLVISVHYATFVRPVAWQVRIQSVTNNAGYQIKFNYESNVVSDATYNSWIKRVSAVAINSAVDYCAPTANACSFTQSWPTAYYASTYTAGSNSTYTITDPLGRATRYTNVFPAQGSTNGLNTFRIKTPASAVDNIVYTREFFTHSSGVDNGYRVTSVTVDGKNWTYSTSVGPTSLSRAYTVRNPQNQPTVYRTYYFGPDYSPLVTSVSNPLNETVTYNYGCTRDPATSGFTSTSAYDVTLPENNEFKATCDARGNVVSRTVVAKSGPSASNLVELWAYPAGCPNPKTCNQPSSYQDRRGALTEYVYDEVQGHGGLLRETLPAVNGVRSQKRYEYAQKFAYVKNASGTLVPAASAIWVPTKISECRKGNSCSTAAETVTSFEYGAESTVNRLLVRGTVVSSGGVSLRTCYSYDRYGNRISETTPRGGLSTCP